MKRKILLTIFLAVIFQGFILSLCLAGEKPIKLKYAHIATADPFASSCTAATVAFKNVFEQRTKGKFQVDLYPRGTLGKAIDLMEGVKNNVIQIHSSNTAALSRMFKPALVVASPFLYRNAAIAAEVIEGPFVQKLLDSFTENTGVKALAIHDAYSYFTFTNNVKPIRTPTDMKGLKFRAMDSLQVAMFKSLGASAVPIAFSELYTSLQTGVVDGQTNPAYVVSYKKFYEVQKYMTIANSQYMSTLWIVCNKQWYDALSPQTKLIVRDAVRATQYAARGIGLIMEQEALDDLRKRGVQVYTPTEREILEFQNLARPACLDWLKGEIGSAWVDGILKAVEEAEKKLGY